MALKAFEVFGQIDLKGGEKVEAGLKSSAKAGQSWGKGVAKAAAMAASAFLAVKVVQFGKDSVAAYQDSRISLLKLENTLANMPKLAGATTDAFVAQAEALQDTTAAEDDAVIAGMAMLGTFNLTQDQILETMPYVVDYSRKFGVDLTTSAGQVGRAMDGSMMALKRNGVSIDENLFKTDSYAAVMGALRTQVRGYAEDEAASGMVATQMLANKFDDLQEKVGEKLAPALIRAADAASNLLDTFSALPPWVQDTALGVAGLGTASLIAAPAINSVAAAVGHLGLSGITGAAAAGFSLVASGEGLVATASLGAAAGLGAVSAYLAAIIVPAALGALIGKLWMTEERVDRVSDAMREWDGTMRDADKTAWQIAADEGIITGALAGIAMKINGAGDATVELGDKLAGSMDKQGYFIDKNSDAYKRQQASIAAAASAHEGAKGPIDAMTAAQAALGAEIDDTTAEWAAQALELTPAESSYRQLADTTIDVHNKQEALNKILEEGKGKTAEGAKAALDLSDAQRLNAQAASVMSDADIDAAQKSGILTAAQAALGKKANDTEGKIDGVTAAINGIPSSKTTNVDAKTAGAMSKAQAFKSLVKNIPIAKNTTFKAVVNRAAFDKLIRDAAIRHNIPFATRIGGGSTPQGAWGGRFAGPSSGYPVTMHGVEYIIPERQDANSLRLWQEVGRKIGAFGTREVTTSRLAPVSPSGGATVYIVSDSRYTDMAKLRREADAWQRGDIGAGSILGRMEMA